ncbi:unnamed protein product [Phaeothamnion confervicola]
MAIDDQSCGRAEAEPRGGSRKRIDNYAAHKAYQADAANPESPNHIEKLCAGPMTEEDGKYMVGSSFLLAATRTQVDAFLANDPFHKNSVWEKVLVNRYIPVGGIKPHAEM